MAKLFFYFGVWLASLINASSEEAPVVTKDTVVIQTLVCDTITSGLVNDLLNKSFEGSKNF